MLPYLTQLPSQCSAQQRAHSGIPDSPGKEYLGKCWRITLDSSLHSPSPAAGELVFNAFQERSEILLGVHVPPLSHTLPVRTKGVLNWACRGDVKFPHRRDTLTRPNITVTASCYLYYNLLSTQFVHPLHTPHIFTFHQRTPHKTAHSGDKLYQTNSLKLIWYS